MLNIKTYLETLQRKTVTKDHSNTTCLSSTARPVDKNKGSNPKLGPTERAADLNELW